LVESNIVERPQVDLSAAFLLLTLTTTVVEIDSEGLITDIATGTGLLPGGYFKPDREANFLGYMDNETYRFAGVIHWKNGNYTNAYFIADKLIDISEDASGWFAAQGCGLNRTTGGVTSSITGVRQLEVGNWAAFWAAIGALVDIDTIDYVEIVRRECLPEVLQCGMLLPCSLLASTPPDYYIPYDTSAPSQHLYEAIFPQMQLTNDRIMYRTGDILNFGYPQIRTNQTFSTGTFYLFIEFFEEDYAFYGAINYSTESTIEQFSLLQPSKSATHGTQNGCPDILTITASWSANVVKFTPAFPINNTVDFTYSFVQPLQYIVSITNPHPAVANYVQYFRTLTDKYGLTTEGVYQTTGARQNVNIATALSVAGGDTFIHKYATKNTTSAASYGKTYGLVFYTQSRVDGGMRNNNNKVVKYPFALPNGGNWNSKILYWMEYPTDEGYEYSPSYTPRNNEQIYVAFDPKAITNNDLPVRIRYSESKPQGSLIDFFNKFLALNFHDLYLSNGEIVHHENFNDQLITFQSFSVMQQYFNNQGLLSASTQGTETAVLIGDGSVMGREGQQITSMGSDAKWSVIQGLSRGGDNILAWWNTYYGQSCKYAADGTIVISDLKMRRWFRENTQVADFSAGYRFDNNNYPTDINGNQITKPLSQNIYGVYNRRYNEFWWSVEAVNKNAAVWLGDLGVGHFYKKGDLVICYYDDPTTASNPTVYFSFGYGQIPKVWRSVKNQPNPTSPEPPTDNGDNWEIVPLTDTQVYNYYTFVYSVDDVRWLLFTTPKPNIWMQWRDTMLSAPMLNRDEGNIGGGGDPDYVPSSTRISDLYLHEEGIPCVWYQGSVGGFTVTGRIADGDYYKLYVNGATSDIYTNFGTVGYVLNYSPASGDDQQFVIRSVQDAAPPYIVLYEPFTDATWFQMAGMTTSGSKIITGLSDTSGMTAGSVMVVKGTGIGGGTVYIDTIDSATQITLTVNSTITSVAPVTLSFALNYDFTYRSCLNEEPYIEYLLNQDPADNKRTHSTQIDSNLSPIKLIHYNDTEYSYNQDRNPNNSLINDFKYGLNFWNADTHNNTGDISDNLANANFMTAQWWKVKMFFSIGVVNKVKQIVHKFKNIAITHKT